VTVVSDVEDFGFTSTQRAKTATEKEEENETVPGLYQHRLGFTPLR
jgi:hypothetical protein